MPRKWRGRWQMTLESDTLDPSLVEYLARKYVVEVWEENGRIMYRISERLGIFADKLT